MTRALKILPKMLASSKLKERFVEWLAGGDGSGLRLMFEVLVIL
jgi:hypothetical protein